MAITVVASACTGEGPHLVLVGGFTVEADERAQGWWAGMIEVQNESSDTVVATGVTGVSSVIQVDLLGECGRGCPGAVTFWNHGDLVRDVIPPPVDVEPGERVHLAVLLRLRSGVPLDACGQVRDLALVTEDGRRLPMEQEAGFLGVTSSESTQQECAA